MKEALTLALEALENMSTALREDDVLGSDIEMLLNAAAAIRVALAQPEQEPFEYWNAVEGWVKIDEVRQHFDSVGCGTIYKTAGEDRAPLYTSPPQRTWVGLAAEDRLTAKYMQDAPDGIEAVIDYIEAKLKEKNT